MSCTTDEIVITPEEADGTHLATFTLTGTSRATLGYTSVRVVLLKNGSQYGLELPCDPALHTCTVSASQTSGIFGEEGNGFAARCTATSSIPVLTSVSCRFEITVTPAS